MSAVQARPTEDATDGQDANGAQPLFRPEVLARQERFFGNVIRIRPIPLLFWVLLAIGGCAIACCLLFCRISTGVEHVRGVSLGGTEARRKGLSGSQQDASVTVPRVPATLKPGTPITVRCLHGSEPAAQFAATVRSVSAVRVPVQSGTLTARQQNVTFFYPASLSSSANAILTPGAVVDVEWTASPRSLLEVLKPSGLGAQYR